MQGYLALVRRFDGRPILQVPDLTFSEERAERAFQPPDPKKLSEPLTPTERGLSGTLTGLIFGQLCDVQNESGRSVPVRELQLEYLAANNNLFGVGPERAIALVSHVGETVPRRRKSVERYHVLRPRLAELLEVLGRPLQPLRTAWFGDLLDFAVEATENTTQHGRTDHSGDVINSIRFLTCSRHYLTGPGASPRDRLASDALASVGNYLDCLDAYRERTNQKLDALLEVTVGDGGVGVAGRVTGNDDIYSGPFDEELRTLSWALRPGTTTAPPGESGRGEGFKKMLRACHKLHGVLVVRTGRLAMSKTYLDASGSSKSFNFQEADSEAYNLGDGIEQAPLLAGTTLSLLFPLTATK
jgi:hypothetical protein